MMGAEQVWLQIDWSTVDAILITQCARSHRVCDNSLMLEHSFHLDHAASLTYIMENVSFVGLSAADRAERRNAPSFPPPCALHPQTNFKEGHGKVYMTHPTKAVYRFLMQDFVRLS